MTEEFFVLLECLADDEQWQKWESEASKLELPLDYYIAEFVLSMN